MRITLGVMAALMINLLWGCTQKTPQDQPKPKVEVKEEQKEVLEEKKLVQEVTLKIDDAKSWVDANYDTLKTLDDEQKAVFKALSQHKEKGAEVLLFIEERAQDKENAAVRKMALESLVPHIDLQTDEETRKKCIQRVAKLGSEAAEFPEFKSKLESLLKDDSAPEMLRNIAFTSLIRIGLHESGQATKIIEGQQLDYTLPSQISEARRFSGIESHGVKENTTIQGLLMIDEGVIVIPFFIKNVQTNESLGTRTNYWMIKHLFGLPLVPQNQAFILSVLQDQALVDKLTAYQKTDTNFASMLKVLQEKHASGMELTILIQMMETAFTKKKENSDDVLVSLSTRKLLMNDVLNKSMEGVHLLGKFLRSHDTDEVFSLSDYDDSNPKITIVKALKESVYAHLDEANKTFVPSLTALALSQLTAYLGQKVGRDEDLGKVVKNHLSAIKGYVTSNSYTGVKLKLVQLLRGLEVIAKGSEPQDDQLLTWVKEIKAAQ